MKTRLLVIIGMVVIPLVVSQGFAMCVVNDDWSEAPCFDTGPITKSEFKDAWMPYHDYKGAEWMGFKKTEMFQALDDGVLNEWTKSVENSNVYQYYISTDEIQKQFDYDTVFREETFVYFLEILILSSPIIVIGSIIVFVIRRKRK